MRRTAVLILTTLVFLLLVSPILGQGDDPSQPPSLGILWALHLNLEGYHTKVLYQDDLVILIGDRKVLALDPESLEEVWSLDGSGDETTQFLLDKGIGNATGHGYDTSGLCGDVVVRRLSDGQVVGVDATTGEKRWAFPIRLDWGTDRFQVAAGRVYALKAYRESLPPEGGQLYVLDGQSGQPLWSYPDTEGAPLVDGGLMIKEGIVYTFVGERLTALSTDTGRLLWQSDTAFGGGYTRLFTVDDVILSSGYPKAAVNAQSGSTLWHRDNNGYIIDVLSDTVLIAEPADATASSRGSSDEFVLRLMDPVTGDTRHLIMMTLRLDRHASVVSAGSDAFFLYSRSYLYAFGPPGPARTVARARTFLTQGDYRSAAHTLRLLKANDPEGYREADGESVAVAALTTWLDEVQVLFDSGQINRAENLLKSESKSLSDLDSDLEAEAASLELRDILARRQYILTEIALTEYDPNRYPYYKTPRDIPEYRGLKEKYSDTEWAALIEQHPIWRDLLFRPRGINLTGWMWFIPTGWIWFIPLVLPLLYFVGSCFSKSRRLHIREQIIVTLFCIWASYLYLWQHGGMLFGFRNELARAGSICGGARSGTLTLTIAAPLVSWLLTMRKERRYGIEALALNWLNWLVLLGVSR